MSYLCFEQAAKTYPDGTEAVAPFDLDVNQGELIVFLGPSGCGKTTLMRMAGGLESISTGRILLDGSTLVKPDRRRGMVFQSYSSFPWLSVAGNIAYGMRYRQDLSFAEKKAREQRYLEIVGLTEFADAWPNRLSGGMRQRVAIARTLAAGSDVLLMDEPFGALDAQRREVLQVQLLQLQHEEARTIIFVTHDVDEAAFLADRVIVFTRRPARVLDEIDIKSQLGSERSLATRDSEAFFRCRSQLLALVRSTAAQENS